MSAVIVRLPCIAVKYPNGQLVGVPVTEAWIYFDLR